MKKAIKFMHFSVIGGAFLLLFQPVKAQTPSSRTGNPAPKQVVTQAEFNQYPQEIQTIVRNTPELYTIQRPSEIISQEAFNKLSVEKKQYVLDHPELFSISKPEETKKQDETFQTPRKP